MYEAFIENVESLWLWIVIGVITLIIFYWWLIRSLKSRKRRFETPEEAREYRKERVRQIAQEDFREDRLRQTRIRKSELKAQKQARKGFKQLAGVDLD